MTAPASPTATATSIPATPADTAPPPLPTPELGTVENPLILALAPSASTTPEQVNAARELAANFTERTGYTVVVVAPDSQGALVEGIAKGNAHIVLLDALAYALAYQEGQVTAVYAVEQDGKLTYGAQFIASRKSGLLSFFDETTQANTADAAEALAQLSGKKPCWSDETSPSGYIIPLGYLNKNLITIQPAAFVQGQPTVVRSVYAGGICDFGATYIDARKFPSLEDQYPDLMEQVKVIWRTPEIIPYSVLALSTAMPEAMRTLFTAAIPAVLQTDKGKTEFQSALGVDTVTPVNDAYFSEFHLFIANSKIMLSGLIK